MLNMGDVVLCNPPYDKTYTCKIVDKKLSSDGITWLYKLDKYKSIWFSEAHISKKEND